MPIPSLNIDLNSIKDPNVRDAFYNIVEYQRGQDILNSNLQFFSITFSDAIDNFRYPHKLGFLPKDVFVTAVKEPAFVTFNYSLFTSIYLDITASAPCTVRFFAGSFSDS